jgi:hypothetical protein
MKYNVEISYQQQTTITVDAESEDNAYEIAVDFLENDLVDFPEISDMEPPDFKIVVKKYVKRKNHKR